MPKKVRLLNINNDQKWPVEGDIRNGHIVHLYNNHGEKTNPIPSKTRVKNGLSSERYHHAVAEMAYGFWEKGGRAPESHETNWFKAEAALKPLWSTDQS